jgi:FMN phosphatase YigB (HAD superfamily)
MRPVAVFDIDGVLADVRHRLHFVERRPKDWSGFFAAADGDGLYEEGARLLRELAVDHDIRFLTGRPERLRALTATWLARHGLPDEPLAMRPDRDRRPARMFKHDVLLRWLEEGTQIALMIDDDPAVIAVVERLGVPALEAAWQHEPIDEQQTLWQVQERDGRT